MLPPHNRIRLSLSAVNRMDIKSLIHSRTVTKSFSFYKIHIFDFTTIFCNIVHFIFQYVDSVCFISYLIMCFKLALIWNFNFFAKVYPANYLIIWNLSVTLYNTSLPYSMLIYFALIYLQIILTLIPIHIRTDLLSPSNKTITDRVGQFQ